MSDLISRKQAIDAIPQTSVDVFENCRYCNLLDRAQVISIIKSLPSSDRPTGEWIKSNLLPHGWHCSICDSPIMTDDISEMLYCPNCGTRMTPYKGGDSDG